jgi:hypothetical protein
MIAILGWGSLIWNPGELAFNEGEGWKTGGPELPIEFSHQSANGRLTLVIDEIHGAWVSTRFARSSLPTVDAAVRNLMTREGATNPESIGFVEAETAVGRARIGKLLRPIADWCRRTSFTHAVWTDFGPKPGFTVNWAVRYLSSLEGQSLDEAREYILKAPVEVQTPLRARLREDGWLTPP